MAYDSNYLTMITPDSSKNGPRVFALRTVDAAAAVDGAGYVTGATDFGMRLADLVMVQKLDDLTTPTTVQSEWKQVSAISAAGAATLVALIDIT